MKEAKKKAAADEIIGGLNNAEVELINPAGGIEFYGTSGVGTVVKNIMSIAGPTPPETYEEGGTLRKKLRLYGTVRDLFNSTTTS